MKPYVKPELYYENFELAQHIAGCNVTLEASNPMDCTATGIIDGYESRSWFLNNGCTPKLEDYCITNSTINMNTISS